MTGPRNPRFVVSGTELTWRQAIGLIVAWAVVIPVGAWLEPAAADPEAAPPVLVQLLGTVMLAGWVTAAVGLVQRRRFGAVASLASAGALLVAAVGCPASGHHDVGAWWYAQLAGAGALVGLSARASMPALRAGLGRRR